ncbi:sulfatase-like hydrolase/transferase [Gilvimarinus sp. F26214L]|uniref:sulfatase-like hydrolase/transferase n=1 Tax=Gilvimarinus sp. DZF01 TaxID=3461371 RepID=UPI0040465F93
MDNVFLVLSAVLAAAVVYVCKKKWSRKSTALGAALLFVSILLLDGAYVAASVFTGHGIDESVIYHLKVGLEGAGFSAYLPQMMLTGIYVATVLAAAFLVYRTITRQRSPGTLYSWSLVGSLAVAAVVSNPAAQDFYTLFGQSSGAAQPVQAPQDFRMPQLALENKKNLVFVYLESLERTYLDQDLFPGLAPNIAALEEQGLSFTDIRQVGPTGWTIAGMVANQCGLPLLTSSHGNAMSGLDRFLPNATCLGDLLSEQGYSLSYMGGASLQFSGKGAFYNSHGFHKVRGKNALLQESGEKDYTSHWGVYDDTLFRLAKEEFSALASRDEPFGLFMLTLDTHSPEGHVSRECEGVVYGNGDNPMLNAVHCADKQIADFVDYVRNSKHGQNTLVVVASDHLAMGNTASNMLQQRERRNLLVILDPENKTPARIHKPGSALDNGATVLDVMGVERPSLGFGRSLLDDEPTLASSKGDFAAFLRNQKGFVDQLWSYPQLDYGMAFNAEAGAVVLGTGSIKLPALFTLDRDGVVDEVLFEFTGSKTLEDHIEAGNYDRPILWADRCAKIRAFANPHREPATTRSRWCFTTGSPGAADLPVWDLTEGFLISKAELLKSMGDDSADKDLVVARLSAARTVSKYGMIEVPQLVVDDSQSWSGDIIMRSSGQFAGPSFVEYVQEGKVERLKFRRGLTLVGFATQTAPVKLKHVDTCEPQAPHVDPEALDLGSSFGEIAETSRGEYGAFAVVAFDSAWCDREVDYDSLFAGLKLEKWQEIGFRQPYIAFLSPDGTKSEWLGVSESTLAVRVKNFLPPRPAADLVMTAR